MRSNPMVRIISVAVALTVLASSAASAQRATPPPTQFGPSLKSSAILNILDHASTNARIESATRDMHVLLGGKTTNKKGGKTPGWKDGWNEVAWQADTSSVIESVLEMAQLGNDVIVISGGDNQATVGIAGGFYETVFIDIGQQLPCVTVDGQPDDSGTCEGSEFAIPANYSAVEFAVEDGAYLAGVLAAAASRDDRIGIISGSPECVECNRYIKGFVLGARRVAPDIDVELAYLADDEISGFGDPVSAQTFAEAFIDVFEPDVLLPVGRGASVGMIEAACKAGILAVGTEIDVSEAHPDLAECMLISITRDVGRAAQESMHAFADRETQPSVTYDLANDGIGLTREWQRRTLPSETAELYKRAETDVLTGQVDACPGDCGAPVDLTGPVDLTTPVEPADDGSGDGAPDDGAPDDGSDEVLD